MKYRNYVNQNFGLLVHLFEKNIIALFIANFIFFDLDELHSFQNMKTELKNNFCAFLKLTLKIRVKFADFDYF